MRYLWLALALLALGSPSGAQTVLTPGLYCVQPCPTPTAPPTATPTPTPTPTPIAGVPYGPTSPWNVKVSSNPTVASYSAAVIAQQFGSGNTQPVRNQEAGPYDYGHPLYFAKATDPLITLKCTLYCTPGYPTSARIPAVARPAGGSDSHFAIVQPDGSEVDMWGATKPSGNWTTGATETALNITSCGAYATGTGFAVGGNGSTAGQACLGAGILSASDMLAGQANHALFLIAQCWVGSQYPTPPGTSTQSCSSGSGPALGGRLWYDVPDATTNATSLPLWSKVILNALHDYGGYLMDNTSGTGSVSGIAFMAASGEETFVYGLPNPYAALATQGWTSLPIPGALELRWTGDDPWNPPGLAAHLHWLAPCSAQGTC